MAPFLQMAAWTARLNNQLHIPYGMSVRIKARTLLNKWVLPSSLRLLLYFSLTYQAICQLFDAVALHQYGRRSTLTNIYF